MQQLASKVEELDMEKRKRNLFFFSIPTCEVVSCEQLVGDVLQNDLGITDNIDMDQARVGSGILVMFQSLKLSFCSKPGSSLPTKRYLYRKTFRQRCGGLMEY